MKRAPATAGAPLAETTVPAAADSMSETEAARALTDGIKADLGHAWDHLSRAWDRLAEAYNSRAWAALGYETWDAYCAGEFTSGQRFRLPAEARRAVVESLREAGLSQRGIASAVSVSQATVSRDLESGDSDVSPADAKSATRQGLDGKHYPARSRAVALIEDKLGGELLPDAEVVEGEIVPDEDAGPISLQPAPPVCPAPKAGSISISAPKRPKPRAATTRKQRTPKPKGTPVPQAVDGLHAALREQLSRLGAVVDTHGHADDPARWTLLVLGEPTRWLATRDRLREYADDIRTIARLFDAPTKAR